MSTRRTSADLLQGYTKTAPAGGGVDLAVTLLRVSTKKQLYTAIDIDADGNSIATQRDVTALKADALGATITREFIEPGNSGKTVDQRPVLKELLGYLHEHPEVRYVIVYMRSRAFRNHFDAALVQIQLSKIGVRLVSAKEDFGQGAAAVAMEGMVDIMNGFQNTLQGLDVQAKMGRKARAGGTVSLAKIGYLNIRAEFKGKLVNTVGLDPERAPLLRKAWEMYASGEYTITRLEATMADLGLTSRPTQTIPPGRPVSSSTLQKMLRDPYYAGFVRYKDELYTGRHEALVSQALFDQVQDVLDARSRDGQRDRIHMHYLKNTLFCERCHRKGENSRLIFTKVKGHNGSYYEYFLCRGRQEGHCDLPHQPVHLVEDAIVDYYATLGLPETFITDVRERLESTVTDNQASTRELHASLTRKLAAIDTKESRLIDLAADDLMPRDKIRQKLNELKQERARIEAGLTSANEQLSIGAQVLRDALHLVEDPQRLYRDAPNGVRRHLNSAFYERFYLDDLVVTDADKTPLFDDLHEAARAHRSAPIRRIRPTSTNGAQNRKNSPKMARNPRNAGVPSGATGLDHPNLGTVLTVPSSSKTSLVGVAGFEPTTSSSRTKRATKLRHTPL